VREDICPVRWAGQQALVAFPEHMDQSNAGRIGEALLSVVGRGTTVLIADMTATIWCDHAGAGAVVRVFQRAVVSGTELRLVVTAPAVSRVLSLSGVDRLVPIYPSLEAAMAASAPVAAEEDRRGRELLDTVVTSLFRVGLSLQAATGLPGEAARQRIDDALGRLDEVIRQIRDAAFTARGHGTPSYSVLPGGAAAARSGAREPRRPAARAGVVEHEPAREAAT
jgi:anti-sigma B factor antagonist